MRRIVAAVTAVTFAALLMSLSGCSWVFVDRAPTDIEPGEHISCTESRAAPIVDTVLAVIQIFGAIVLMSEGGTETAAGGASYLAIGAIFGASALSGFMWTERCRTVHDDYEESFVPEPLPGRRAPRVSAPKTGRKGEGCRADGSCEPGLGCHQGRCLDLIK